ncbi:unnamed protein product [Parajaminaea phylloscopi]
MDEREKRCEDPSGEAANDRRTDGGWPERVPHGVVVSSGTTTTRTRTGREARAGAQCPEARTNVVMRDRMGIVSGISQPWVAQEPSDRNRRQTWTVSDKASFRPARCSQVTSSVSHGVRFRLASRTTITVSSA